jgi:hypothetical protein
MPDAALERRIADGFRARLGESVTVEVARVHDLPRTSRGKVRAIVPLGDMVAQSTPTATVS